MMHWNEDILPYSGKGSNQTLPSFFQRFGFCSAFLCVFCFLNLLISSDAKVVLDEDEYEVIRDDDEELLDGLLGLLHFLLFFFLSLDMPLACFSGEESSLTFLAGCAVQILAVE